jgi:S-methylmethionine-dependent homocysteine/selenocysteine methylase
MLGRRGAAVLLDGGMGHQLKRMGVKIEGEVGTMQRFLGVALANEADPPMVRDAHLAYIDAGADVITTNNYAVVPAALELSPDYSGDSAELQRLVAAAGAAARAAVEARPECTVRVAGCLPPLHESYRADRVATFDENIKDYRLIASAIAPYADVLLCETMSTAEEGLAAA